MDKETAIAYPRRILNRYEVVDVLGEGNFGIVYRARDTRLPRQVAIKTIKPSYAPDRDLFRMLSERFSRESHASSVMGSHPNLVIVYDFAIAPDNAQYLILEYVPGKTLEARIKGDGALGVDDALRLTADIARALFAAHQHDIVHRDIKPANIFIAADGRAQVGDFGVAQVGTLSARTYMVAGHLGTPLYMSPEQEGTTGYLHPESDQFTVGLVLFEMLTGQAYKRLRKREVAQRLTQLSPAVRALIERMTAADPDDRYESLQAVETAIAAMRQQLARHEADLKEARSWFDRGYAHNKQGQYTQAIAGYTRAIALNPEYATAYHNRGYAYRVQGQYTQAIADYTRAIALNPEYATAYHNRGYAYRVQGQYTQAIADYTRAIALNPEYATAYGNRGSAYYGQGQYEEAIADYTRAIALNPEFATAYGNRGIAYYEQGQYEEAIADYTRAIELNPEFATAYHNRGNAYYEQGQYEEAIADYTCAIELNPEFATAYHNRGNAYRALKQDKRPGGGKEIKSLITVGTIDPPRKLMQP